MMIHDDDRAEAERLKLLPRKTQREIIAMYRDVAASKGVPARERKAGMARVVALERLLKLVNEKRKDK
ncbi:MAG: hypothetical protein EXS09_19210 [Gemmataceae bacterium]|nr:hypothetical protein [Gemmataceae bacterium]